MSCPYCIKRKWGNKFEGNDLKLDVEPSYKEVIDAIKDPKKYDEVIFCGYGDCLINIEAVKKISRWIKDNKIYGDRLPLDGVYIDLVQ